MHLLLLLLIGLLSGAEVYNANVPSADEAPLFGEGVPFRAAVKVRNPYDRAVKIARVDSTCTCSKLEPVSRFLLPGEATVLEVEASNAMRSGEQKVQVSLFTSDPDFAPIEVMLWWRVREQVSVDAIAPGAATLGRPADPAWRDVYRYVVHERPDEPQKLKKRIRLACPPEEAPPGGLRVEAVEYAGRIWAFEPRAQEDGSVLVIARARDPEARLPEGQFDERVTVRTNHPGKSAIVLQFQSLFDMDAGRKQDLLGRDPLHQPLK
jgi:hypothetical protein